MKLLVALTLLALAASTTATAFNPAAVAANLLLGRMEEEPGTLPVPEGFIPLDRETKCLYVDFFTKSNCEEGTKAIGIKIGATEEDKACIGINVAEVVEELKKALPADQASQITQITAILGSEVSVGFWIAADGTAGYSVHLNSGDCSSDKFDPSAFGGPDASFPELPKITHIPPPLCLPFDPSELINTVPGGSEGGVPPPGLEINFPKIESLTINGYEVSAAQLNQEECRPEGIFSSAAGIIGVSAAGAAVLGIGGFAAYKTIGAGSKGDFSAKKPEDDLSTMGETSEDLPPKY